MRAELIEIWGVKLGRARPMMGGWLILPAGGALVWTWAYANDDAGRVTRNPRLWLEDYHMNGARVDKSAIGELP